MRVRAGREWSAALRGRHELNPSPSSHSLNLSLYTSVERERAWMRVRAGREWGAAALGPHVRTASPSQHHLCSCSSSFPTLYEYGDRLERWMR